MNVPSWLLWKSWSGRPAIGLGMTVGLPLGRAAARLALRRPRRRSSRRTGPASRRCRSPASRPIPPTCLPNFAIGPGDAGLRGDIGETAVAEVAIEDVALHAGDEDIGEAVVVEVADGDRHRIAFAGQPGLGGDVGKRQVAVVAKQAVVEFRAGLAETGNGRAVGEEDVRAAVVVVVENARRRRPSVRSGGTGRQRRCAVRSASPAFAATSSKRMDGGRCGRTRNARPAVQSDQRRRHQTLTGAKPRPTHPRTGCAPQSDRCGE